MVGRRHTTLISVNAGRLPACLLIFVSFAACQSKAQGPRALWRNDVLQEAGRYPGVSFLGDEKVLVYDTEYTGQLSVHGSPETTSEFKLRLSVLDARSGAVELTRDWGTHLHRTQVMVTADGVLVKTGGIAKLYASDFKHARDLPVALDPSGDFFISVSASGRTIAIVHDQTRVKDYIYTSHVDLLDATTLKLRSSWDQYPPVFRISMSDESFVIMDSGAIAVAKFANAGWRPLIDLSRQECGDNAPTILSNGSVVLRDCKSVLFLSPTGESYPLGPFNGRGTTAPLGAKCRPLNAALYAPRKVAVASNGERFIALTSPDIKIKRPVLAESRACLGGLQVAVYDLNLRKRVFTVNVEPLPQKDFDFALSPDGSLLAVLNDGDVSVYSAHE